MWRAVPRRRGCAHTRRDTCRKPGHVDLYANLKRVRNASDLPGGMDPEKHEASCSLCGREQALWARFHANLARAETAMVEAVEEPFVKGSTGQLVEHPGLKMAARATSWRCGWTRSSPRGKTGCWGISRLRADEFASASGAGVAAS
jgi:hypothetical protein